MSHVISSLSPISWRGGGFGGEEGGSSWIELNAIFLRVERALGFPTVGQFAVRKKNLT